MRVSDLVWDNSTTHGGRKVSQDIVWEGQRCCVVYRHDGLHKGTYYFRGHAASITQIPCRIGPLKMNRLQLAAELVNAKKLPGGQ